MKRIILVLAIILGFATIGMSTEVLYRISSGEVYAIVPDGKAMPPPEGFTVVSNPVFIDGTDLKRRVLGRAKIYNAGEVKNATAEEITNFPSFAIADMNQLEENEAKSYFQNDPNFRRFMKAISAILAAEFNRHQDFEDAVKAAAADAISLADFKTRMAVIEDVPERSDTDLLNAIRNRIDKDD